MVDLLANLCLNNGKLNSDMSCTCQPGFVGSRCQQIKRNQRGCLNNGVQPKDGLPCKCPPGYFGFRCEYVNGEQNELVAPICRNELVAPMSPCMNGGVSISIVNLVLVVIYIYILLFLCQKVCTAINSGFICSCATGYHGKYCQYCNYLSFLWYSLMILFGYIFIFYF